MATGTINERSVDGAVNLIPDENQHILNVTVDEGRRRLLADDPAAAAGTGREAASALPVDGLSDAWIRSRRGRKIAPHPSRPITHFREEERRLDGSCAVVLHVLLAGAECPFTCVFCDLWRRTLDGPTPPGAIPRQLAIALHKTGPLPATCGIKLYNASNFFDPRAVPAGDDEAIAALLQPFDRVTVECHPRLVGRRCLEFADRIPGRLEVAMGLETADAAALARLNKGMTLADFDRTAARLSAAGIGLRVFVQLPAPFVPAARALESALDAVRYAVDRGAGHVTLIPGRDGNGALDELREQGHWTRPAPELIEEAAEGCARISDAVVTVDLWDSDRFLTCRHCRPARVAWLRRFNDTGSPGPRVRCPACTSSS